MNQENRIKYLLKVKLKIFPFSISQAHHDVTHLGDILLIRSTFFLPGWHLQALILKPVNRLKMNWF